MEESDFEGTLVLEKLAEIGLLDEFWGAIDSDNFNEAKDLMGQAGLETGVIEIVLRKMQESDGNH